jgi:hypothetical protein
MIFDKKCLFFPIKADYYSKVWLKGHVEFSNCPFKSLAKLLAQNLFFLKSGRNKRSLAEIFALTLS